jgi:hypothetical protein
LGFFNHFLLLPGFRIYCNHPYWLLLLCLLLWYWRGKHKATAQLLLPERCLCTWKSVITHSRPVIISWPNVHVLGCTITTHFKWFQLWDSLSPDSGNRTNTWLKVYVSFPIRWGA